MLRLTFSALVLISSLIITGCVSGFDEDDSSLNYACDDVVVVGRVATINPSDFDTDSDPPFDKWYSRWELEVRIKRLIYGFEKRPVVPAFAVAHAQIRDDKDMVIVMTPRGEAYEIRTLNLASYRPKISPLGDC